MAGSEAADVPWYKEPCMMGVDEAGRGPVLGPMVYAVAYCSIAKRDAIAERSFADSKTLTEEKRETLYEEIAASDDVGYEFDALTAQFISGEMLRSTSVSLNVLANESTYKLIQSALDRGVNLKEVYVDTVGPADSYQQRLSQRFPGIQFTVCPKADALYPIVSAASIVAKVTRDRMLKDFVLHECDAAEGGNVFGSGYPGDPDTKAWLEANMHPVFGFPSLVRFSWSTSARILEEKAVKVKWQCDEPADQGQKKLSFGGKPVAAEQFSSGAGRHSYFRARGMQRVTSCF